MIAIPSKARLGFLVTTSILVTWSWYGGKFRADSQVLGRATWRPRTSDTALSISILTDGPMQTRQALLTCKILYWEWYTLFVSHGGGVTTERGSNYSMHPRPVHKVENSVPYPLRTMCGFFKARCTEITNKGCRKGTTRKPIQKRLEILTIRGSLHKGSYFCFGYFKTPSFAPVRTPDLPHRRSMLYQLN